MKKRDRRRAVARPHVRKGDLVAVLTGDERGRHGKVLQVFPKRGRAVVEGINLVKKHMRKTQENPNGGIVDKEATIALSNLKPVREAAKADAKAS